MTVPLSQALRRTDLVRYLVKRELKVRYRRSAIGLLWTILQPLLTMLVLKIVFSAIFRFELPAGNYEIYALSGILFWSFFSQSITASMNSLKGNAGLLTKLPVPRSVFPLAVVLAGMVNLTIALFPLMLIVAFLGGRLTWSLLFLPVSLLIAGVFTLGVGLILAPLAAFFHDLVEVVGVALTLAMYMTPIFYPMSIVPDRYLWMVRYNPVRSVLEVFRDPFYLGKIPPVEHIFVAVVVAVASLLIGSILFRHSSDRIALYV